MSLTVLSVGYPLAAIAPDAAGGTEQVVVALDRALIEAGHRSVVVAPEGSCVAGTLVASPLPSGPIDGRVRAVASAGLDHAIAQALDRFAVDVVHMHGLDFADHVPPPGPPLLASLHLPVCWYAPEVFALSRPRTFINCVSLSQHHDAPPCSNLLPPVPNGIALGAYGSPHAKRGFALMLSRICPEKGVHLALDAAHAADVPLLIGGEVFPYPEHERYFAEEVAPRLDGRRRYLGRLGPVRKRRLLGGARCLIVASTVAETSSLAAREALASGTPVVALARGALPETVDHGRTGFLVEDVGGMAAAIRAAGTIDPAACRATARERFSDRAMFARYFDIYQALATGRDPLQADAAA